MDLTIRECAHFVNHCRQEISGKFLARQVDEVSTITYTDDMTKQSATYKNGEAITTGLLERCRWCADTVRPTGSQTCLERIRREGPDHEDHELADPIVWTAVVFDSVLSGAVLAGASTQSFPGLLVVAVPAYADRPAEWSVSSAAELIADGDAETLVEAIAQAEAAAVDWAYGDRR